MNNGNLTGSLLEQESGREPNRGTSKVEAKPLDEIIQRAPQDIAAVFSKKEEAVNATVE